MMLGLFLFAIVHGYDGFRAAAPSTPESAAASAVVAGVSSKMSSLVQEGQSSLQARRRGVPTTAKQLLAMGHPTAQDILDDAAGPSNATAAAPAMHKHMSPFAHVWHSHLPCVVATVCVLPLVLLACAAYAGVLPKKQQPQPK